MDVEKFENKINWPEEEQNGFNFKNISNTRMVLLASLFGQLIFICEWLIPRKTEMGFVITQEEYTSTVSYHVNNSFYLYTTAGKVRISEKEFLLFDYHDTVLISKTRFNDIITKVELIDGDRVIELQTIINIFFPFLFFPILGFLSAVLGIYSKKILKDEQDIEFKFGVLSCLFFAITCAVYLLT